VNSEPGTAQPRPLLRSSVSHDGSINGIKKHNRLICAKPIPQQRRPSTIPNRRSEIVRAKDNVSDYGGA
jgi:hypothetical protein